MDKVISGEKLGMELCRIFGRPTERVESVTITAEASRAALVNITRLVTDEEAMEVYTLLENFKLCDRTEHKQVHPQGFGPDVGPAQDDMSKLARQALAQAEELPDAE